MEMWWRHDYSVEPAVVGNKLELQLFCTTPYVEDGAHFDLILFLKLLLA
jgi:hypothetical protein